MNINTFSSRFVISGASTGSLLCSQGKQGRYMHLACTDIAHLGPKAREERIVQFLIPDRPIQFDSFLFKVRGCFGRERLVIFIKCESTIFMRYINDITLMKVELLASHWPRLIHKQVWLDFDLSC